MPGGDRGLRIDAVGEQNAGGVEKRLPGNAELLAVEGNDELAVQSRSVAVEGRAQDECRRPGGGQFGRFFGMGDLPWGRPACASVLVGIF